MSSSFRIAIDASEFDTLPLSSGQRRYAIDLITGLHACRPSGFRFRILGASPTPIAEMAVVFASPDWEYMGVAKWTKRARSIADGIRYSLLAKGCDLIHSLSGRLPFWGPRLRVVTVHDLFYELFDEYAPIARTPAYRLQRWMAKHRAQQLIAISQATAKDIRQRWQVPPEKMTVVPHGSRFLELGPQDEVLLPEPIERALRENTLLSLYNLEPRKNLNTVLDAIAQLKKNSGPPVKLLLAGCAAVDSARERAFQAHVKALNLSQDILLTGPLTDKELFTLYRRSTLFLFPTLGEGFGYPALEAMASGACVVAKRASAMEEIIGEAGILLTEMSSSALAKTIAHWLRSPLERKELAEKAQQRAKAQFTVRAMAERTLAVYRHLLMPTVSPESGRPSP